MKLDLRLKIVYQSILKVSPTFIPHVTKVAAEHVMAVAVLDVMVPCCPSAPPDVIYTICPMSSLVTHDFAVSVITVSVTVVEGSFNDSEAQFSFSISRKNYSMRAT